jgi:putative transposase
VAWGLFRQWVEYFAKKYGRVAIAVDPRGTSQICSGCGQEVKKTLAIRVHNCSCGLTLNRDENAAINVLNRATTGRVGSQAQGEKTATLFGENLVEQVLSMN